MFNEIFSDACIRHHLGVSFSPRTLKLRIISEVEDYCSKNGVNMPSARTIRNYVALLKSIGLKFVTKPQLRDLKVHVNRCSFRNACTAYCIAFITHEGLSVYMIMNIDPTTVVFGYKDNSFSAAVRQSN